MDPGPPCYLGASLDEYAYAVKVVDQTSAPIKGIDQALKALQGQLASERKELSAMEGAMRSLNKASVVDIGTHRALSAQITAKKDSVAGLTGQLVHMGAAGQTVTRQTGQLGKSFSDAAADAASSDSAISSLGAEIGGLLNPITLVVGAVTALGAAFAFAVSKGVSLALSAAQAKNDVQDSLSIILDTQEAVDDTYDRLGDISDSLGTSAESTQKVAESLALAGITSADALVDAVNAVQTASKLSESAGQKIQGIIEKSGASGKFELNAKALKGAGVSQADIVEQLHQQTGKSVKALVADLKAGKVSAEQGVAALTKAVDVKLGAKALEKGRGFDESVQRLKNSLVKVFEDVNIKPLEDALANVADWLAKASSEGGVLHDTLVPAFNKVFEVLAAGVPYAEALFLGLILVVLKLWNAFRPLREAIADLFPKSDGDAIDTVNDALVAVADAVGWVSEKIAVLLSNKPVLYTLIAAFGILAAVALLPVAALVAVNVACVALIAVLASLINWLVNLGASAFDAATNLIAGLIEGIVSAGPRVVSALKGVATDALAGFKKTFGIASPSKVMMGFGVNISQGLVKGVEQEDPVRAVRSLAVESVASLGSVGSVGAPESGRPEEIQSRPGADQASAGKASGQGGLTVSFPGMQVTITGVERAEDILDLLPAAMYKMFEQASLTMGSSPLGSGR